MVSTVTRSAARPEEGSDRLSVCVAGPLPGEKKEAIRYCPNRLILWSGKRESDPRHRPWQGRALPLSYSRAITFRAIRFRKSALREKGLEPSHPKVPDPKSGVSAIPPLSRAANASGRQSGLSRSMCFAPRRQTLVINLNKKGSSSLSFLLRMSRAGIEPATRRLRVCCSAS